MGPVMARPRPPSLKTPPPATIRSVVPGTDAMPPIWAELIITESKMPPLVEDFRAGLF